LTSAATEVAFHFGAPDKVVYAVRLLRKAVGTGVRVLVLADTRTLQALDAALWASAPSDFLPHCLVTAPEQSKALSPIWLAQEGTEPPDDPPSVLVNLADTMPLAFEAHARVIEVVSTDEGDRVLARARWKTYKERGFSIVRHDLRLRS
jgi:DNA polymerase-3 subunit chi